MKTGLFIGLAALNMACSSEPKNRDVSLAGAPPSGVPRI